MIRLRSCWRRVRGLWHAEEIHREIDEEMRFHIDMRVEESVRRGMSPDEARREALRRFGDMTRIKEQGYEVRGGRWLESFWRDSRHGVRVLLKNPGFAAVAVITLALGIGANTAIFSVVNAVLLRPLPYRDAERLLTVNLSLPDYYDLRDANQVFDRMAVFASNRYNIDDSGEAEQVLGAIVSPDFFALLGAPSLGRTFRPEEDAVPLVVIGHDLWRRRFAGSPDVLGAPINLNGKPHTIVGVMPPDFQFPNSEFKLWVTMGSAMAATPEQVQNRALRIFRAVAHLKPGVSLEQAQADVDRTARLLQRQHPDTNSGIEIRFVPLYERIVGDVRTPLLVLFGAVGLVLLIACANVANLLLARAVAREREIAIRMALGAGRLRVVRQLLTESVLLAGLGGILGVLLAVLAVDLLPGLGTRGIPRADSISVDVSVLSFSLVTTVLTGVLFGLTPALQATKLTFNESLKEGGRGSSAGPRGRWLRGALVVFEVALSVVVLIGAGLLTRSFATLLRVDPGFAPQNLLTINVGLMRYQTPQQRAAAVEQVLERVRFVPGVEAAGGGTGLPPQTAQRGTRFEVEGLPNDDPRLNSAYFLGVTPGYLRALGTPLITGRDFTERDGANAPGVVMINSSLARRLFPGQDPTGRRLRLVNPEQQPEWRTIVGVVGDVRYAGLDDPGEAAVYTPFAQTPFPWVYLMVRAASTHGVAAEVAGAVRSADNNLVVAGVLPMDQLVAESVAQPRFNASLLTMMAGLALVLATIGIYGVISYSVSQRTHEIGIRLALGAKPSDVLALIIGQGARLTLAGIGIGLLGAVAVTRVIESLLFGVSPTDPLVFAGVALLLSGVALAASYIPALRAARVDPLSALRYE